MVYHVIQKSEKMWKQFADLDQHMMLLDYKLDIYYFKISGSKYPLAPKIDTFMFSTKVIFFNYDNYLFIILVTKSIGKETDCFTFPAYWK